MWFYIDVMLEITGMFKVPVCFKAKQIKIMIMMIRATVLRGNEMRLTGKMDLQIGSIIEITNSLF